MKEWESKVLIFLSVDLCGATHYKTKHDDPDSKGFWQVLYENFIEDFTTSILNAFNAAQLTPPSIWKFLGDEIIFYSRINSSLDAYLYTKTFFKVFREQDDTRKDKKSLRLKSSAWIAGFPIRNQELKLYDNIQLESYKPDFIGFDMDIGFRIGELSRHGRMVCSLDLTDLIADYQFKKRNIEKFTFYHVGWDELKGVYDNNPYPVFWLELGNDHAQTLPWESHICKFTRNYFKESAKLEDKKVVDFIKSIRDELFDLKLFRPYFGEENMPEHHKELKDKMIRRWEIDDKSL